MNLVQQKYFALLHSSKKTSYSDLNSIIFYDAVDNFVANNFITIKNNIKLGKNYCGYFSYEMKNDVEKFPEDKNFFIDVNESFFVEFSQKELVKNLSLNSLSLPEHNYSKPKVKYIKSNMTKAQYYNNVTKIIEYIKAGDIYQANLTRKFYGEFEDN
jgi:anthranilate/para-aminobenzoate synthase component I